MLKNNIIKASAVCALTHMWNLGEMNFQPLSRTLLIPANMSRRQVCIGYADSSPPFSLSTLFALERKVKSHISSVKASCCSGEISRTAGSDLSLRKNTQTSIGLQACTVFHRSSSNRNNNAVIRNDAGTPRHVMEIHLGSGFIRLQ